MEVSGQPHVPAPFILGKHPLVPNEQEAWINTKAGLDVLWEEKKSHTPHRFKPSPRSTSP